MIASEKSSAPSRGASGGGGVVDRLRRVHHLGVISLAVRILAARHRPRLSSCRRHRNSGVFLSCRGAIFSTSKTWEYPRRRCDQKKHASTPHEHGQRGSSVSRSAYTVLLAAQLGDGGVRHEAGSAERPCAPKRHGSSGPNHVFLFSKTRELLITQRRVGG